MRKRLTLRECWTSWWAQTAGDSQPSMAAFWDAYRTYVNEATRQMWAQMGHYFWLPCPLCGEHFAGFETFRSEIFSNSVPDPDTRGLSYMICPQCTIDGHGWPSEERWELWYMSSPMIDLPEHAPMPINAEGNGPETDPDKVIGIVCWCGDNDCTEWRKA